MIRNELLIYFPQKEFFCNEKISGYAELKLPMPFAIEEVFLDFIAVEACNITGKQDSNEFIRSTMVLTGPGSKNHGVDWLGRKKKQVETVPQGTHKYPFEVVLPTALPPSYTSPYARIEYFIRITVKSGKKGVVDLISQAKVNIGGTLFDPNFLGNFSTPRSQNESRTFLLTKGTLDYIVNLDSGVFLSGDIMKIKLDMLNSTSKTVNASKLQLLQKVDIYSKGKLIEEKENILASLDIGGLKGSEQKHPAVTLMIPQDAPETIIKKQVGNATAGKIINLQYFINVEAEVSLGSNLKMQVPIYIIKASNQYQQQQVQQPQYQSFQQPQQQFQQPQQQFQQPQQQFQQPQQQLQQPQYLQPQLNQPQQPQQQYQQPQQQIQVQQQQQQLNPQSQQDSGLYPNLNSNAPQFQHLPSDLQPSVYYQEESNQQKQPQQPQKVLVLPPVPSKQENQQDNKQSQSSNYFWEEPN